MSSESKIEKDYDIDLETIIFSIKNNKAVYADKPDPINAIS